MWWRRREPDVGLDILIPEGPAAPALPDRRVYGVAAGSADSDRLYLETMSGTLGYAQQFAQQQRGVVVELPVVADYRDEVPSGQVTPAQVNWRAMSDDPATTAGPAPLTGGPIRVVRVDAEDDGSVTIYWERVEPPPPVAFPPIWVEVGRPELASRTPPAGNRPILVRGVQVDCEETSGVIRYTYARSVSATQAQRAGIELWPTTGGTLNEY